jgi:uncharacterized protein (DUF58 family)
MTRSSRVAAGLTTPGVRFAPDFLERCGRLVASSASARERREGAGRSSLVGAGTEFVGFRPYRVGEDLRLLDWNLYARMRKPFVRVARREASERWAVLVDGSASMGVGRPSKLQAAAEIATGIAAVGRKQGAEVELFVSGVEEGLRLKKRADLRVWMRFLERARAEGEAGLSALVDEPARFRAAGALFLVGDLCDLEPRDALSLARRGRDLFVVRVLAEEELTPAAGGPVRWVDAETGHARPVDVNRKTVSAYEGLLSRELEAWGAACARHRAFYGTWRSDAPFESVVRTLFED